MNTIEQLKEIAMNKKWKIELLILMSRNGSKNDFLDELINKYRSQLRAIITKIQEYEWWATTNWR